MAGLVHRRLFLAGASPEEMMENKYTRSAGFTPYDWLGYGPEVNHFQMGGGLGLRGYAGYVAPELTGNGDLMLTYRGNSGAALNAELADKWPNITQIGERPADAAEWDGKPNKLALLER